MPHSFQHLFFCSFPKPVFDGFRKRRIPGKNGEGAPRKICSSIWASNPIGNARWVCHLFLGWIEGTASAADFCGHRPFVATQKETHGLVSERYAASWQETKESLEVGRRMHPKQVGSRVPTVLRCQFLRVPTPFWMVLKGSKGKDPF